MTELMNLMVLQFPLEQVVDYDRTGEHLVIATSILLLLHIIIFIIFYEYLDLRFHSFKKIE